MRSGVTVLSVGTDIDARIGSELQKVVSIVECCAGSATKLIIAVAFRTVIMANITAVVSIVAIVAVGTF